MLDNVRGAFERYEKDALDFDAVDEKLSPRADALAAHAVRAEGSRMSIIDWEAIDRDGMPAFVDALKRLERHHEALQAEYIRNVAALYGQLQYQEDRRKDDRAIRNEIDARLAVVEEQVANLIAAVNAPRCAVCHAADATTGPDGKLCADCLADVKAGIEDAGPAGMRVRRPRATHRDWQQTAGSYCPECRAVVMWGASRWRTCEYCGAELEPVTSVRNDAMPAFPHRLLDPFAYPAMRVAASNNGADHDGETA